MVDVRNHLNSGRAPDALGALRRAVADLHQTVDERSSLGTMGLDVHRYGAALLALARVLPGVEQELIRHGADREAIAPLSSLLLDDVRSLGLDVGEGRAPIGDYDDPGAWWGAAYVLAGSRLGAAVIVERLVVDLPEAPRSYFDAAAADAAPSWARFRSAARTAFGAERADLDRATVAARAVFEALLAEFDRAGLRPTDEGRVA